MKAKNILTGILAQFVRTHRGIECLQYDTMKRIEKLQHRIRLQEDKLSSHRQEQTIILCNLVQHITHEIEKQLPGWHREALSTEIRANNVFSVFYFKNPDLHHTKLFEDTNSVYIIFHLKELNKGTLLFVSNEDNAEPTSNAAENARPTVQPLKSIAQAVAHLKEQMKEP